MKNKKNIWWLLTGIAITAIIGGTAYVWYKSKKYKDSKINRNIQIVNTKV